MAQVTVSIGGNNYTVSCRDGEEDHLRSIARIVDGKVSDAVSAVGGISEVRQLLFASLLLADELQETGKSGAATAAAPAPSNADEHAEALENIAGRLEALATRLENSPATA
jgi:cell division protein ZapA